MNKKIFNRLDEIITRDYPNTAGIIVQKDGEMLYENYFNGSDAGNAVHIASVTKSIFSALIGIAIEKGFIESVEQRLTDFFPNRIPPGITLKQMLTMTAPYKCETEPYEEFFSSGNWLEFALDLLDANGQAGKFSYSPIVGTHILSGVLAAVTGEPILQFADKNLFKPLGIEVTNTVLRNEKEQREWYSRVKNPKGWVVDPQGLNPAGWGLTLTPKDMIKIAGLYLNGGKWEDRRLLPEEWIHESTTAHARWEEMPLSYGYLWWVLDGNEKIYAAVGDGGNVIYINEGKKMAVAIASYFAPDAGDTIALIKEYIEPLST